MKKTENVGFQTKELSRLIDIGIYGRCVAQGMDQITVMNSWIFGYLKHHQDGPVYQKDLECGFHMPKSTLTGILQDLEKKGYIERVFAEGDARKKAIILTEKGETFSSAVRAEIRKTEEAILEGIDPERLDTFIEVLGQMTQNASAANAAIKL